VLGLIEDEGEWRWGGRTAPHGERKAGHGRRLWMVGVQHQQRHGCGGGEGSQAVHGRGYWSSTGMSRWVLNLFKCF
jgi:hypothetical protein